MNTASSFSQIPSLSRSKMFIVKKYFSESGQNGATMVTIDTEFNNIDWRRDVHIRIVIGAKPIPTEIKSLTENGEKDRNLWRCTGVVPEFEAHKSASTHTFNVTIQAVDNDNTVLDTTTFGYFTYQEKGPSLLEPGAFDVPRRGNMHLSTTQPNTAHCIPLHREARSRTSPAPLECKPTPPDHKRELRRHEADMGHDFEPVSLVFATKPSLADLGKGLSEEELGQGRRLISFERTEAGDKLYLSFRRISREEYNEGLVVVSCIYRKETHETWYTSVDMIKLVEYIAQTTFVPEEKSRIRRNLEFLHPTTVSRTGMPQFFQTLMDFPIPKPRVIEKDIKVFRWNSLEAGLKKVLEKYTWVNERASTTVTTNPSPRPPEPVLAANKFQDASQHHSPHSLATLALSGANTPNNFGRPELMSNMLIDPRWVHSHGDRVGLMTSHYVGGGAMPSPGPQSHITPAEVGHDDQTTNPFPELEFISSPGHIIWC